MQTMMRYLVPLVLAIGCHTAPEPQLSTFLVAGIDCGIPERMDKVCVGRIASQPFEVSGDGRVRLGTREIAHIPVAPGWVQSVYAAFVGADLLVVYEAGDFETGWGGAVRIEPSGAIVWHEEVPGINVGFPLIEGDTIYLSSIGYLGARTVKDGALVWQHTDLYSREDGAFTSFGAPTVSDDFLDYWEGVVWPPRPIRGLRVHRETGELSEL